MRPVVLPHRTERIAIRVVLRVGPNSIRPPAEAVDATPVEAAQEAVSKWNRYRDLWRGGCGNPRGADELDASPVAPVQKQVSESRHLACRDVQRPDVARRRIDDQTLNSAEIVPPPGVGIHVDRIRNPASVQVPQWFMRDARENISVLVGG